MQTMRDQIVTRIDRPGEERAFPAKDFLDVASRTTIDVTLAELALDGAIRRIRRGLYDKPKVNPALGCELSPGIDGAAGAIARRQNRKIVPEGAWAANLLGLTKQVPAKIIYLTDGPSKSCQSGAAPFISSTDVRRQSPALRASSLSWSRRYPISGRRAWDPASWQRSPLR